MAVVRLGTCGALQPGTLGKIIVPSEGCVWVHRNPDAFASTSSAPAYDVTRPVYPDAGLCNGLLKELEAREAFGRAAEPFEVANVIIFLASEQASYMTGEVLSVSSQHA